LECVNHVPTTSEAGRSPSRLFRENLLNRESDVFQGLRFAASFYAWNGLAIAMTVAVSCIIKVKVDHAIPTFDRSLAFFSDLSERAHRAEKRETPVRFFTRCLYSK
jgi:hypothetical protein